jgi:uncharacterized LabA/DUF88 family protein
VDPLRGESSLSTIRLLGKIHDPRVLACAFDGHRSAVLLHAFDELRPSAYRGELQVARSRRSLVDADPYAWIKGLPSGDGCDQLALPVATGIMAHIPLGASGPRRDAPQGASAFCAAVMRTRIYVDAFNLYYGTLRGTRFKWLDLDALCRNLLKPANRIEHITARVSARDGDHGQPQRQELYFRALRTIPHLTITLGHFLSSDVRMATVSPSGAIGGTVLVRKTEEKGSDVNLATLLVKEGFQNLYDVAVVVSNDSDLLLPIEVVKVELGKPVGVFNPHQKPSSRLRRSASFYKQIRKGVLGVSQFPTTLRDRQGSFTKPAGW